MSKGPDQVLEVIYNGDMSNLTHMKTVFEDLIQDTTVPPTTKAVRLATILFFIFFDWITTNISNILSQPYGFHLVLVVTLALILIINERI